MTTQFIRRGLTPNVSIHHVRTLSLLLGVLILFGSVYVGQSTQATLNGQRVQDLQEKLERLQRENAQLEYDIAALNTPVKIAARARALGLHPATPAQMIFLTVKNYPAPVKLSAPVISAPKEAAADSSTAATWNQILMWLGIGPGPRAAQAATHP